jgi:hypothetical protein
MKCCYKMYNNVPLSGEHDTPYTHFFEMKVFDRNDKVIYYDTFVNNHEINKENIDKIAKIGPQRWKIENEAFNVLKNNGYNLEHNFGHGKEHLSNVFTCFNVIAFLVHNVSAMLCDLFHRVRSSFGAKARFFQSLSMILSIQLFDSWWHLLKFMEECFTKPPGKIPK